MRGRMIKHNNKTSLYPRGFTIVELLIVIVVIAILAAITIVAYNGITADANASRAKGNAQNILKVATAYSNDEANPSAGTFPTPTQLTTWTGGVSKVPSGVSINSTLVITAANSGDGKTITYMNKGTTGGCVGYWDSTLATPGVVWLYAGNATAGTNAAPPTCA
jgi:type IV pilus assembly protein PilA